MGGNLAGTFSSFSYYTTLHSGQNLKFVSSFHTVQNLNLCSASAQKTDWVFFELKFLSYFSWKFGICKMVKHVFLQKVVFELCCKMTQNSFLYKIGYFLYLLWNKYIEKLFCWIFFQKSCLRTTQRKKTCFTIFKW